jgi:hypothetical protein
MGEMGRSCEDGGEARCTGQRQEDGYVRGATRNDAVFPEYA